MEIVEIADEQAYDAKLLASALSESKARKRAMIDMLGISCAINYLNNKKIRVNTKRSVYKIPLLFEEFKITDIYHGNYRIDVITLYREKTIKIPKIHSEMDIMPHFYFVVQIGAKIKEAKMIGFIDSKSISTCSSDSKFFYPTLDMIFDVNKFVNLTRHSVPAKTLLGKHIDCLGLFLKFIDNDLSSLYKRQMIQHLMNCDSCRARFIDVVEFEKLANNIKYYPDVVGKNEAKIKAKDISSELQSPKKAMTLEESLENVVLDDNEDEIEETFIDIEKPIDEKEDFSDKEKPKTVQMFDLSADDSNRQSRKNVIDAIFNEIPKLELPQIKAVVSAKHRRTMFVIALIFIILGSFAFISIKGSTETLEENTPLAEFEEASENYDESYSYPMSSNGQAQLIPKETDINDFIIKQPVSNSPAYSPSVAKISWEAPESIVKKDSYIKFLQLIGKNIKLNLQNDLLLVNDVPINKIVKLDIKISSTGNIDDIKLASSSGTVAIDDAIKKVINDTLTYMKPPSNGIISKAADVTLVIELK